MRRLADMINLHYPPWPDSCCLGGFPDHSIAGPEPPLGIVLIQDVCRYLDVYRATDAVCYIEDVDALELVEQAIDDAERCVLRPVHHDDESVIRRQLHSVFEDPELHAFAYGSDRIQGTNTTSAPILFAGEVTSAFTNLAVQLRMPHSSQNLGTIQS